MPLYDYHCRHCGEFSETRPLAESSLPQACPACGAQAPRIIGAPRLATMDPSNRMRWERNERSKSSPQVARRSSCGCSGTHTCGSGGRSAPTESGTDKPALRTQSKRNARPWMLGH